MNGALEFAALIDSVPGSDEDVAAFREAAGVVVRQCRGLWRSALLMACSLALAADESMFADEDKLRSDTGTV